MRGQNPYRRGAPRDAPAFEREVEREHGALGSSARPPLPTISSIFEGPAAIQVRIVTDVSGVERERGRSRVAGRARPYLDAARRISEKIIAPFERNGAGRDAPSGPFGLIGDCDGDELNAGR